MIVSKETRRWVRCEADEKAVAIGCRFNQARADVVLNFARKACYLYEGDKAGEALEPVGWQIEAASRLFGWEIRDERGVWVRRFREASIWIPKKNGKTPTLAWWGLYLLVADGENGQKVYSAAKNGDQARLSQQHAVEMVRQSPILSKYCSINKQTLRITFEKTSSFMAVLSSDNERNQQAKEGLNGSVLVDETHVVDEAFMRRVTRAGISRREPLHIEVSTAGKDVSCYGHKRYEYGKRVNSGEIENHRLLYMAYEAPQDTKDEDIQADPIKIGKLANPMWGILWTSDEYRGDYVKSSTSGMNEWMDFKTYRLNIWQTSASPFLRGGDWRICGEDYTLESLHGRQCWVGLDLGFRTDPTAIVLVFHDGYGVDEKPRYILWPIFFVPEESIRKMENDAPWHDWARNGDVVVTPGDTVDEPRIIRELVALNQKLDLQCVLYDRRFAQLLAQRLQDEYGLYCEEFDQRPSVFTLPTKHFHDAVVDHRIQHPRNPCLDWMAGNVAVTPESKGDMLMPCKPGKQASKKIDGIVAAIMGVSGAAKSLSGVKMDYYDTHEMESF